MIEAGKSPPLLPEIWSHVLSFATSTELCRISSVNKEFKKCSSSDFLWEKHCEKRWKGKQNVSRFRNKTSLSWKQRYAWAENDRLRQIISRDEICHFSWKFIYKGQESKLGLRKFKPDGTYYSPYAGVCEWSLFQNKITFLGVSLPIQRDIEGTWGWIIGADSSTVYHSMEQ